MTRTRFGRWSTRGIVAAGLAGLVVSALGASALLADRAAADDPAAKSPGSAAATDGKPAAPRVKHVARKSFDWSDWQKLPVFHGGRIKPVDTFADEVVTIVTGRSKWNPFDAATPEEQWSENPPPKVAYKAHELLYAWITEPEAWVHERVIRCEYRPLRKLLNEANDRIPVEGSHVALNDVLDWTGSRAEGRTLFRSQELERRLSEIANAGGKSPETVGETSDDKKINGKVGELFRHIEAFLNVCEGRSMFLVPGLDPRVLTKQTDPDDELQAWMPLSSLLHPEKWQADQDLTIAALMAADHNELLAARVSAVAVVPQLAQAFKFRDPLVAQLREIKPALDATRAAYDRGDAQAFGSAMQTFVRQVRRLADNLDAARQK